MAPKSILEEHRGKKQQESYKKATCQVFLLAEEEWRGFSQEFCLLLSQSPTSGSAAAYVCIRWETALCASYGKEAPIQNLSVGPGSGTDMFMGHTAVCLSSVFLLLYLKTTGTYDAECPSSKAL